MYKNDLKTYDKAYEDIQTLEISASTATCGRLNGWKEGTTVQHATHG